MLVEYGCVGGLEEKTEYRGMQRWVMGVGQERMAPEFHI